jgi:hypothetical protein
MEDNYYVYVYLNPLKKGNYKYGPYSFKYEPFYVGEGKNNRFKNHINEKLSKNCNKHKIRTISLIKQSGKKPIIFKVFENLTKDVAQKYEISLIKLIGRKSLSKGPLTNLTDGGDGVVGSIRTHEMRKQQSEKQKGRNKYYEYTEDVGENLRKTKRQVKLNVNILQYDIEGNLIKEWDSLQDIRDNFKQPYKIKRCCNLNKKKYFLQGNSKLFLTPYHMIYDYIWIWKVGKLKHIIDTETKLIKPLKVTNIINNKTYIIENLTEFNNYGLNKYKIINQILKQNIVNYKNLKIEML